MLIIYQLFLQGSMSSSTTTGVTVIWDFQYAWIPEGYDLRTLKTSIETALKRCNPDFFIEGKLLAVGHASGDRHQAITMLPDDIKFSPVRPDNIRTPDPEGINLSFDAYLNWSYCKSLANLIFHTIGLIYNFKYCFFYSQIKLLWNWL